MGKYTTALERRSSIPRREYLEDRIRGNLQKQETHRAHLVKIKEETQTSIKNLQIEYKDLCEQLNLYKYSPGVLETLAKHEKLPISAGIYAIFIKERPVYVGEAENVQKRALDHLQTTLNLLLTLKNDCPPLYEFLGRQELNTIECNFLEEVQPIEGETFKVTRLRREGHWCNKFVADGYTLFNKNWVNKHIKTPLNEEYELLENHIFEKHVLLEKRTIVSREKWNELRIVLSDELLIQNFAIKEENQNTIIVVKTIAELEKLYS